MGRPTSADMLAHQLERAHAGRTSPSPALSGRTTSPPSTPWLSDSYSSTTSPPSSPEMPRRNKLVSRSATARDTVHEQEDLEDELNDFGYGSTRRAKPKESLMDLLNSEPPAWMTQEDDPKPVQSPSRKTNILQKKMRIGSTRSSAETDPTARFSTLRSFKSSSSILGRSKSSKNSTSADLFRDDDFRQLIGAKPQKLVAKDSAPSPSSTRDLADFLRSSAPPAPTLSRSASSRGRSSTTGSIETATTSGSARILRAVKAGASKASLIRSDSGSSQHQRSIKEAVSPGAESMFDASLWRSNLSLPNDHEHEESLHETVSLKAAESMRRPQSSGNRRDPSSSAPPSRSPSAESGLASFPLQRNNSVLASPSSTRSKRLSRKPPPSADDLEAHTPTSSSRPSRPLVSQDTLRLIQQANEDDTGRYTIGESPIKGRAAPPPLKMNGHLDHRASSMTFGRPANGNGRRPRSEFMPPSSPGTSYSSTPTSSSASEGDSPPSPRRTRETSAALSLDDGLIEQAMAFANMNNRDYRRSPSHTSFTAGVLPTTRSRSRSRQQQLPPPEGPLPAAPAATGSKGPLSMSFPATPSSRPVSIAIHQPSPFGARLSTLSNPETVRRPPSIDSVIDPPLSEALEERFASSSAILVALRLLRRSMQATAELPLATEALADEEGDREECGLSKGKMEALLPTLKGLQAQLKEAAGLIELVVRFAEKGSTSARGEKGGKEEEEQEAFLVGRLLGGEGDRDGEEGVDSASDVAVIGESKARAEGEGHPQADDSPVEENSLSRRSSEESLFPLLVKEIDAEVTRFVS